ncbi:MAG: hypothetical protein EOM76_08920 [Sphingobacteriia bacterium]|nr:hypothetical protein [Sphingobacteriia bacterium]
MKQVKRVKGSEFFKDAHTVTGITSDIKAWLSKRYTFNNSQITNGVMYAWNKVYQYYVYGYSNGIEVVAYTRKTEAIARVDYFRYVNPDYPTINQTFEYQLLDRCKEDCIYSLQTKNTKCLWGITVQKHIDKMKELFDCLVFKPEWLSLQDIEEFDRELRLL